MAIRRVGPRGSGGSRGRSGTVTTVYQVRLRGDKQVERRIRQVASAFGASGEAGQRMGRQVARGAGRAEKSLFELTKEVLSLRAIIPTLAKALVSGIGITVVFGTVLFAINSIRS